MDVSIWYLVERILMLSIIAFLAAFAIYHWKIATVRPSLLAKFSEEAGATARKEMAAEKKEHEAVIEDFTRRIKNAQIWLATRKQESREITHSVYDDLYDIRSECLKIRGASRNLLEACSLINGLARHKNFMKSITTSQKSRIQSVSRETKAEVKAVEMEVTELKSRVDKAEQKLKATEWIHDAPPIVAEMEPQYEAMD